ncbi:MAG: ABC transporter permease [Mycobacteriales bacterium]
MVAPSRPGPGAVLSHDEPVDLSAPAGGSGLTARVLPPVGFAALVAGLWSLAAASRPDSVLPSPWTVLVETWRLLLDGGFASIIGRTASTMAVGFGVSALVGVALGLGLARRRLADRAVSPYLIGLQSLPSAVWIPVAVIFLGASSDAVLAVTILGALPSIAIGTRDAVHSIPPILLRAARTLGADGRILLLRVVVPAALPGIVSGLEHGWAFAFRSLVAGELIIGASGAGLGFFVATSRDEGRVDHLLAAVLVIMLLGVVVDRLGFARLQRRLREQRGLGA